MEKPTFNTQASALEALQQLIDVVAQLRSPVGGCPWDLAQTPQTLTPYVIEEAYEVVNAIQCGEQKAIAEELGDLLLQVVLQAQIASEEHNFSLTDVAQGITEKLIRRHPHVFGNIEVKDAEEVRQNWEQIKAEEKGETVEESQLLSRKFSKYASTLPPLMAGMKISQKAAAVGFEWDNIEGVWSKFQEELGEFKQAIEQESLVEQQAELGDVLFTLIQIARWYKLDPAEGLQGTNRRFIQRFAQIEEVIDRPISEYTLSELDVLWNQAKVKLADKS
jgi:XTP/dITP diphosphohydrolase